MAILTLNKCIILTLCLAIAFFHHGDGKKQSKKAPRGHLQQLGLHRDPEGHVDIITEPLSAKEFWTKYVSKRRPVLLRGAASSFPAKELWVDSYLSDTYGNLSLKIEGKLEEDPNPVGDMGLARDTIKHFMNTYVQDDKYVISQLPKPMYGDVLIPPCMSCGLFKDSIIEVNFWLSSGGTRSLLHKDAPLERIRNNYVVVVLEFYNPLGSQSSDSKSLASSQFFLLLYCYRDFNSLFQIQSDLANYFEELNLSDKKLDWL
ncbi:uncharacterized protein TRIADDRAFT_57498 [Trichoplax adhaerens]|uniref:Cupin-like domain-containing protein n=1 Tax=Trichoplax adhaerens TaxID=10228 RepID=B3RZL3_TRIAD|nr:hypothetical protein TRIADDRAFT_57498 [Trichoplax adhaerens]EDV24228.1 hypothetical protein TRIADDRAFT_57498 [Trichoplax adhaerens]|eukprot:XP_002113754.1 hypothetical protein TRIADDRAFT_57498 [Trichoplax adhaerens]